MTTTTIASVPDFFENDYIYFHYDKYLLALKHIGTDKFIDMIKEAEVKEENSISGTYFQNQKIVYELLKQKKGIYYQFMTFSYFSNYPSLKKSNSFDINSPADTDLTEEHKIRLLDIIKRLEVFKIMVNILNVKDMHSVIRSKLNNDIDIAQWAIENSSEHYKNNTHFFEIVNNENQFYYKKYFEKFTYPVLSENIIKSKLENAIKNGNLYLSEYWMKRNTGKITIEVFKSTEMIYKYKIVEMLIKNGYIENGNWVDLSPTNSKGTIFEPLFTGYHKKIATEKFMSILDKESNGIEIELINFLVQKLKK